MLQMLRLRRRPVLVRSQPQRVLLLLLLLLRCKSLQRVPLLLPHEQTEEKDLAR